jgi:intracellular sulfur oxidation DsrE/DsrF family protein
MKRGSFIAASASLVAAAGSTVRAAEKVPGGTHFVERKADFDSAAFEAAVGKPADVRQLWNVIAFHPGVFANIKNSLNGLEFGYGYSASRLSMVFAPHGPSTSYNYSDYIWDKYKIGDAFKLVDAKGAPVTSNVFLKPAKPPVKGSDPDAEDSIYQDVSIETLQSRGVVFLTCHTAVEEQARNLIKGGFAPSGMTPSDVADDLLTYLIPGTHVVPSMVATVAVLQQRYHYSYIAPTFA